MRQYPPYLWYLLRHKWYVFVEAVKEGIPWRGFMHDMSKLRPSELIPYARFFYNKSRRDKTGYYKPTDTGDPAFDYSWFLHTRRNDHHWQHWVLPLDEAGYKILPMSEGARVEMMCDWKGAGRAQGTSNENNEWYKANGHKLQLHPETRAWIEEYIGYDPLAHAVELYGISANVAKSYFRSVLEVNISEQSAINLIRHYLEAELQQIL